MSIVKKELVKDLEDLFALSIRGPARTKMGRIRSFGRKNRRGGKSDH